MSSTPTAQHITYQPGQVTRADRARRLEQTGGVVWFTGLSGAGKTTIARALEVRLMAAGHLAYVLDGDNLRHGLNADLGFAPADRQENIRRVGEVAALLADAGLLVLTAFIAPYRRDRERARATAGAECFLEVYVDVPLEVCARRDPRALYRRAQAGEIAEFTGISAPYEPPEHADLVLPAARWTVEQCVDAVMTALRARHWLEAPAAPAPESQSPPNDADASRPAAAR